MAEFTGSNSKSINVGEHVIFENNTDLNFEVSAGIVFHKSGIYDVSVGEKRISVSKVAIKPQQQWIPANKKLPEKNGIYIVSYEDAVTCLAWFNGKWFFYQSNPAREETGTITAWCEFPEPYRGKQE